MSNASGVTPVNDSLLVRLGGQYTNIKVKEGKYDTQDSGIVIAYDDPDHYYKFTKDIIGKRVWWKPMREGTRFEKDGVTYAFIELADVQGVEDVKAS